jgi:ribosomal protein L11 methylase PrmA
MASEEFVFSCAEEDSITMRIDDGVFKPTGTTRVLVDSVKKYTDGCVGKLLDLGCGSGVVGLALDKLGIVERPLYASDLNDRSVACAKMNADRCGCPLDIRRGSIFEPWEGETFDYIVDDISGVAAGLAHLSPWFDNVPCEAGDDGSDLTRTVLREAALYMNHGARLFFPVISLSHASRIIEEATRCFSEVEVLHREDWPLPDAMYEHRSVLDEMREAGLIEFTEKFGMLLWSTEIYVAHSPK